jgi:hypothetical protein
MVIQVLNHVHIKITWMFWEVPQIRLYGGWPTLKYLVMDSPVNVAGLIPVYSGNKTFVYENQNALPRAYFANTVQKTSAMEILDKVKNNQFDPKEVAFVDRC